MGTGCETSRSRLHARRLPTPKYRRRPIGCELERDRELREKNTAALYFSALGAASVSPLLAFVAPFPAPNIVAHL